MDAQQALSDLVEISSQIEAAAIVDASGAIVAATPAARLSGATLGGLVGALLESAAAAGSGELVQLEVATGEGSVFVVRDGGRAIVAATRPQPTVGLVFYDLKSALRNSAPSEGGA